MDKILHNSRQRCIAAMASLFMVMLTAFNAFAATQTVTIDSLKYEIDTTTLKASVTGVTSTKLTTASIPASITVSETDYSVTDIADSAFANCLYLTSVTIPESVTSIGNSAFMWCSRLTSVAIPESVTSIGNQAFWECSGLTSVTIPESVTSIGNYAFECCSRLTSVTIPGSVTSIGDHAFDYCTGLTSVTIPESVTSIGYAAFCGCYSLTSMTIPESVTRICSSTFFNCKGLTSVTIPESVTVIDPKAFRGCPSLKEINCYAVVPPSVYNTDTFDESNYTTAKLNVPEESVEEYKKHSLWGLFEIGVLPEKSGIDDIIIDGEEDAGTHFDIYNLRGVLVKEGATDDDLKSLQPSVYILRHGTKTRKVVVK